jgi:hypothetical protein
MKNILLFTILAFLFITAGGQTTDYLQKKEFQTEKKKIYDNIDAAKKPASDLKKLVTRQSIKIDSLGIIVKTFAVQNKMYADSINKMSATVLVLNDQVRNNYQKMRTRLHYVWTLVAILVILILGTFVFLWRKGSSNFGILKDQAEKINENINKEMAAVRLELTDGLAKMHAFSDELNQKFSRRFDQFEAEHGQVHLKIQDNNSSLNEQIKATRTSAEENIQNLKSALAANSNELSAQTKALKLQLDKDIQALTAEWKKAKPV